MRALRVIFAGGGTGGHLFPAIAIADALRAARPDADILFVGTADKIEARVVPSRGFRFQTIWISGFSRSLRASNLLFPLKLVVSMIQARSIIQSFNPDVVVGTGGYVSGPVLRAAISARVPTLIHEQNSVPGVTTRILAPKATEVHVTFESTASLLPKASRVSVSGNPTRPDLEKATRTEGMEFFRLNPSSGSLTMLVFGGSLGAQSINRAVLRHIDALVSRGIRIIWQTGQAGEAAAAEKTAQEPAGSCWSGAFIDRMDLAYAASDVVLCRAGATTIAEITRLGKPAIIVPYPHAAANHQETNARALAGAGGAILVNDARIGEELPMAVGRVLDAGSRETMARASRFLGRPEAAHTIASRIIELGRERAGAAPA